jgi:putative proteasome-type protease
MTYCVAIKLDTGMIFASDSRTNAGVDHIATFTKMKVYEKPDDRLITILSSGNLAVTQGVTNLLDRQLRAKAAGTDEPEAPSILEAPTMYDVATIVGDAVREMQRRDGVFLTQANIDANAAMIVGGQIKGEEPRLFYVYTQGNFIEAGGDTPFFQLGESKYGKPILDRVITPNTPQKEAAKCVLISFDSTMKSNISVGLPIDLLWYPRDSLRVGMQQRIREGDPYFTMLRSRWGGGLRRVFSELPDPDWLE